jgi:uncharacterized YigZ family protein
LGLFFGKPKFIKDIVFLFKTISTITEGVYQEKGSKFLAFSIPCSKKEEVKIWYEKLKKEHPKACHVCFAYRFGADKKDFRASDDGEPNNSAGNPILGQIVSFDLTNILICVVRYYGGTNLGVGGLVVAYKTAAQEALKISTIIEKEETKLIEINCSYAKMPEVMTFLKSNKIEILQKRLEANCWFEVEINISMIDFFIKNDPTKP